MSQSNTLKIPIVKKCFYSDCNKIFLSNNDSAICQQCVQENRPPASNKCYNNSCDNLFIGNSSLCPKCVYGTKKHASW